MIFTRPGKCRYGIPSHTVQLRALRLVTGLTPVYQILHGHYGTQLDAAFCIIDNSRTRGHAHKSLKPHCTIDATKYFFSNRVISTCNNLPDMVVHSPTLSTFERHLSVLDLSCHS